MNQNHTGCSLGPDEERPGDPRSTTAVAHLLGPAYLFGEMKAPKSDKIIDEPGMEERFQRTLRNLINTPPKHRTTAPKAKERPASKGRVHKGKT
jgi:hypothetical protein